MQNKVRNKYLSPCVQVTQIKLEEGIAAGSATVLPPDANAQVKDEWTVEDNDVRVIPW